jgi:hypothetical protein
VNNLGTRYKLTSEEAIRLWPRIVSEQKEKDSKRRDKQKTYQTHPKGVAALRECLKKWGSLTDVYRELDNKGKETTYRQNIGSTIYRRAYTLFRRLDRIYVSRNMTLKDNPTNNKHQTCNTNRWGPISTKKNRIYF